MPGEEAALALRSALLQVNASLTVSWQSLENFNAAQERELAGKCRSLSGGRQ